MVSPDKDRAGSISPIQTIGEMRVLRQLTPDELQTPPTDPFLTPENFAVRGMTDPHLIRNLSQLSLVLENGSLSVPVEIGILESRLQPHEPNDEIEQIVTRMRGPFAQPTEEDKQRLRELELREGTSRHGFIGKDESLLELLASDTETVGSLDLTHQILAEFLFYFGDAAEFSVNQLGEEPQAYTFNRRLYSYDKGRPRRVLYKSPFFDGDIHGRSPERITHIESGLSIQIPYEHTKLWINRWGFYGGEPSRIEPRRLAEFSGYVPDSTS